MRETVHNVDFCVIGGGLAGLCAALAAARKGIKVAVMQDRPVFGGNASSEIRMWICGAHGTDNRETGIVEEIILENFFINPNSNFYLWDSVLFGKALTEKNLEIILNCSCLDCTMDGNTVKSVKGWQTTTQSYHTINAKYFADCSGDSVLAPLTGAEFMIGREGKNQYNESFAPDIADRKTMGMSCLLQARETDRPQSFIPPSWANKYESDADLPNVDQCMNDDNNFWWIELGGDRDSIADTEEVRNELLKVVFGIWDHIKNRGDHGAENWALDWVGFLPGKRESRRYVGEVIINQNDVTSGGRFSDSVAYAGWTMDNHFPEGFNFKPGGEDVTVHYPVDELWGIPWRSLYSKNISNLLFAGRNISVTHLALTSSRVMATCGILGQAVGTGVARAVKTNTDIRNINIDELQQTLLYDDCFIPNVRRRISPVAAKAEVNCEIIRNGCDRGEKNLWFGESGDFLEYGFSEPTYVDGVRIVFDSKLNRAERNMRCSYPINMTDAKPPETLIRDYTVSYELESGEIKNIEVENSHQRLVLHKIGERIKSVRLTPKATWGDNKFRVFAFEPV